MTNLELVAAELEAAKKKHPKFVDYFCRSPLASLKDALQLQRNCLAERAETNRTMFTSVLFTEVYEALVAHAEGDLAHARQELAQCAAVCIRAMEYIQTEMEKTNK